MAAFDVFCAARRPLYIRFAAIRLADRGGGEAAAASALLALGRVWDAALREPSPAAVGWELLRAEVAARKPPAPCGGTPQGRRGDAIVLHRAMGLSPQAAAEVMGIEVGEFTVLHRAALRALNGNR
ncbi:hypothetical protein ACFCXT_14935 [Streptomyces vinaceus]|uniref:hypothetical protein n=1 Tax=Streptomyces vinaceus TaxID=1960 RepID=UPI0035D907E8